VHSSRTWAREFVELLLVVVIFTLFVRTFVIAHINVPTPSMDPAVMVGDHILVNRFVYASHWDTPLHRLLPYRAPELGDVVTFSQPDRPRRMLIKRVVALPGDTVALAEKRLLRDGLQVAEPWVKHVDPRVWPNVPSTPPSRRSRDTMAALQVPAGHVFCLGDNRDESLDSRFFGPVPMATIRGRALLIYWSFEREPSDGGWQGAGRGARHLLDVAVNFFSKTRWERQFKLVR
jgi:signal peptidase I